MVEQDLFHNMRWFLLSKIQTGVPQPYIDAVVLFVGFVIAPSLYIVSFGTFQ